MYAYMGSTEASCQDLQAFHFGKGLIIRFGLITDPTVRFGSQGFFVFFAN